MTNPTVEIKITSLVCSCAAIGTTIYRLLLRRKHLWADDGWAFCSMISIIIQIAAVFMDLSNNETLSQKNKIVRYYLIAVSFYCIIWTARLSILFSIIRIDPSEYRRHRLLFIAALFLLVWFTLVAQLFWVCEPRSSWKSLVSPQCPLGEQVVVFQLVSDVVTDLFLLAAPLRLLIHLQDKMLRYRLMLIFSTCIVTTIVSLVHAAYILTTGGPNVIIAALVEDSISLIVCNIPIVIVKTFRLGHISKSRTEGHPASSVKFATFTQSTRPRIATIPHELSIIPPNDMEDIDPTTTVSSIRIIK